MIVPHFPAYCCCFLFFFCWFMSCFLSTFVFILAWDSSARLLYIILWPFISAACFLLLKSCLLCLQYISFWISFPCFTWWVNPLSCIHGCRSVIPFFFIFLVTQWLQSRYLFPSWHYCVSNPALIYPKQLWKNSFKINLFARRCIRPQLWT